LATSRSRGEAVHTAATALIRCLKDQDKALRVAALKALGSISSSLMKLRSGGETVRASATGFIGCLKDPEADVRSAAASSLGPIPGFPAARGAPDTPPIRPCARRASRH